MIFTYGNSINVQGLKMKHKWEGMTENIMQVVGAVPALPLSESTSQRECEVGKVNLLFLF